MMLSLTPLGRNSVARKTNDLFDFYSIFDDFFNDDGFFRKPNQIAQFRVDLKDEGDHYKVEADLPGFKKEDINLEFEEGRLVISATRQDEVNEEKNNYIHRERKSCSMQRVLYLKDVKTEDIEAKLEDGVLSIDIPKNQNTIIKKQIEIK